MTTVEELRPKVQLTSNILKIYNQKVVTSDEAAKAIKSGDNFLNIEIRFYHIYYRVIDYTPAVRKAPAL